MDHWKLGITQQLTCSPCTIFNECSGLPPHLQHHEHIDEDNWGVGVSDFLDPQYEGMNQDIKWLTKLKWKKQSVKNVEKQLGLFSVSDSHQSGRLILH